MDELNIEIGNEFDNENLATSYITDQAVFPLLKKSVEIKNLPKGDKLVRVWVETTIGYAKNGRKDTWKGVIELLEQTKLQYFTIAPKEVRGGLLSWKAKATVKVKSTSKIITIASKVLTLNIAGTQPINQDVRNFVEIRNLKVILYKMSAFQQFTKAGEPSFSNGFGIFRLRKPSATEIWNWKLNATNAVKEYQTRRAITAFIPEKYRNENPLLYKGLPDFSNEELETETLQSYGKGIYYIPKKTGSARGWSWEKSGQNDNYADECMTILNNVVAGNPPVGWD